MAVRDAVELIVKALASEPDAVAVEEEENTPECVSLRVTVAEADRGRIIGRQGRTINALRTVVKAVAMKNQQKVQLEVAATGDEDFVEG
ncbi:MAG: KH domain-containing protein [Candidatus Sericytochromatia bacterium]|nr:KH domain-containing protein [Candidatus Sericytochromatia bacterium]